MKITRFVFVSFLISLCMVGCSEDNDSIDRLTKKQVYVMPYPQKIKYCNSLLEGKPVEDFYDFYDFKIKWKKGHPVIVSDETSIKEQKKLLESYMNADDCFVMALFHIHFQRADLKAGDKIADLQYVPEKELTLLRQRLEWGWIVDTKDKIKTLESE